MSIRGILVEISIVSQHQPFLITLQIIIIEQIFFFVKPPCYQLQFFAPKENLTFQTGENTPLQTLIFQKLGTFAQFKRTFIKERQREDIDIAKKEGR